MERQRARKIAARLDAGGICNDAGLATGWGASLLTGRRYVILQPSSNEPVYLRFIEDVSTTMLVRTNNEGYTDNYSFHMR